MDEKNLLQTLKDFSADEIEIVAKAEQSDDRYGIIYNIAKLAEIAKIDAAANPVVSTCGL